MEGTPVHWFDYELPKDLIASHPVHPRDGCRLMVMDRGSGKRTHGLFKELPQRLSAGDVLVLNDSAVMKARLRGYRKDTGGNVECLLLEEQLDGSYLCLARPARRLRAGQRLLFKEVEAEVVEERGETLRIVRFLDTQPGTQLLERLGEMPLPPYIGRPVEPRDEEDYQCIYAKTPGSVAAPTAGLHFTSSLLGDLEKKGVEFIWVTLHVGMGTFLPIRTRRLEEHRMHEERYSVSKEAAKRLDRAVKEDRRIIAVGTTVVRVLESIDEQEGTLSSCKGRTSLFIRPGYRFKRVHGLLTNFHLPRSTLLVLVSAFAGRNETLEAYKDAVSRGYRFYSYGDAMLIL